MAAAFMPFLDVRLQMVSVSTSLEVAKRMCLLFSPSKRKKSNTPWYPGVRPVMRLVQAGGVSAGTMVRSLARVPPARKLFRKGITPCAINSSRTVNVAPSHPTSSVFTLIGSAPPRVVPCSSSRR